MKKIFPALLGMMLLSSTAMAQEVTVTGTGIDRDSALRDAERMAVEQIVGTYVDSQTLVASAMVELDEIYTKADGYTRLVSVIQEGQTAGGYTVKAIMDVNTDPNSEFMDKVQMIARLKDPRIAVIVLKDGQYSVHEKRAESIIMERLIQLGFSHVVDANIVAGLYDAQMLRALYNGEPVVNVGSSFGADMVIIGNSSGSAAPAQIPDFKGGYKTVALSTGNMEMIFKIVRPSTGNIIDTFSVESKGIGPSREAAEQQMIKKAADEAAGKIEERLRRQSMKTGGSVQLIVSTGDYNKIAQLVSDLKTIPGVQNAVLREQNGGKAIIELGTNQQPGTIVHMLQKRTTLEIYVHGMTDSMAQIVIP